MKTCNKYNSRCGFIPHKSSKEEDQKLNTKANYMMNKRLLENPFPDRPSMSTELKFSEIPQVIGKFIDMTTKSACVLGVLDLAAGGHWDDEEPRWEKINDYYNFYEVETERQIRCPGEGEFSWQKRCHESDCLMAILFHLNDVHKWSNALIGNWLSDKYNL